MNVRTGYWGAAALLLCAGINGSNAQEPAAVPPTLAEVMPLVTSRSLVLDVAEASARAVMVGERGHILVSESRSDWRQIEGVPTRATLTAIAAVGDKLWAVGHDGVILHSADGGLSWVQQRIDRKGNAAVADDGEYDPRAGAPLLDVAFTDENHGIAVGAFSLMLRTTDGGASWVPVTVNTPKAAPTDAELAAEAAADEGDEWTFDESDLALDEEDDPHLNAIVRTPSGLLMVVGERGAAYRSRDTGDTWERLQLPYAGSMFGVLALGDEHLVAFGLRGHVLETRDAGSSWVELDTGTELSLMGGAALDNGGLVIVGANGVVLQRDSADAPLTRGTFVNDNQENPVLAGVLPMGTRTFLVCGDKGIGRYEAGP